MNEQKLTWTQTAVWMFPAVLAAGLMVATLKLVRRAS